MVFIPYFLRMPDTSLLFDSVFIRPPSTRLSLSLSLSLSLIYIYIYMCVCVCVQQSFI